MSSILDNSLGGVVSVPLSIPLFYDDKDKVHPVYEPIFYDQDGKVRPITSEFVHEYLYGAKLVEKKYNKVVKLYGSG